MTASALHHIDLFKDKFHGSYLLIEFPVSSPRFDDTLKLSIGQAVGLAQGQTLVTNALLYFYCSAIFFAQRRNSDRFCGSQDFRGRFALHPLLVVG